MFEHLNYYLYVILLQRNNHELRNKNSYTQYNFIIYIIT